MEDKAQLVPGSDRRQDDPAGCTACHGEAHGIDGSRGKGQPRRVCLSAERGGAPHRTGGEEPGSGRKVKSPSLEHVAVICKSISAVVQLAVMRGRLCAINGPSL